ncbi:MAG: nuclear transport factor 2 family protein, partial [Acidimicrobiia bacterium]|nr:nuclear transport factor 2 family protein [Acidimicrobiia bacterium]MDX2467714.1 nuclear transport factor 2 family protein [Acidimicrobiia bacterium]
HTQVDGPTEPTDLDKTDENKSLVVAFVTDVLQSGELHKVTDYVSSETYIQHNPSVGDGLAGLGAFVESLAVKGQSMAYEKIHKVVGSGNFVAVLSKMVLAGADMAVIDLFRVKDGLIVEHWDVMEEIAPKDQWVNSGKF